MFPNGDHVWGFKALVYSTMTKKLESPSKNMEWDKNIIIKAVCDGNYLHTDPPYNVQEQAKMSIYLSGIHCGCGIHATWDLEIAYRHARSPFAIMAMLACGPKVVIQQKGFRASHAMLIGVSCPPPNSPHFTPALYYMSQAVAESYELPYFEWEEFLFLMDLNNSKIPELERYYELRSIEGNKRKMKGMKALNVTYY